MFPKKNKGMTRFVAAVIVGSVDGKSPPVVAQRPKPVDKKLFASKSISFGYDKGATLKPGAKVIPYKPLVELAALETVIATAYKTPAVNAMFCELATVSIPPAVVFQASCPVNLAPSLIL